MKILTITADTTQNKVKNNLKRKLYWYNLQHEEPEKLPNGEIVMRIKPAMEEFEGGELSFSYDTEKQKVVVGVKDVEYISYKKSSNEDKIRQWINKNAEQLGLIPISSESSRFVFSFSDENREEIENSLYEYNLQYEIE